MCCCPVGSKHKFLVPPLCSMGCAFPTLAISCFFFFPCVLRQEFFFSRYTEGQFFILMEAKVHCGGTRGQEYSGMRKLASGSKAKTLKEKKNLNCSLSSE